MSQIMPDHVVIGRALNEPPSEGPGTDKTLGQTSVPPSVPPPHSAAASTTDGQTPATARSMINDEPGMDH